MTKELGDAAYARKEYDSAIAFYDKCNSTIPILLNRSAAYLAAGRYDACIHDCDAVLSEEQNIKASYRRAKALYHLGRYVEFSGDTPAARKLRADIEIRRQEAKGIYDWSAVYDEAQRHDRLDRAEYEHGWEVRQTTERGRGAFAVVNLKAGTIIVVSKAIAFDDLESVLERNPSKDISDLQGSNLEEAIRYNSFEPEDVEVELSCLPSRKMIEPLESGLWRRPSYFNHSCLYNCTRIFLKDLLIIKAARDIRLGEELTLGYINRLHPKVERQKCFEDFDFECQCSLCMVEVDETGYEELLLQASERPSQEIKQSLARVQSIRPLNAVLTIELQTQNWPDALETAKRIESLCFDSVDDLRLGITTLIAALTMKLGQTSHLDQVAYAWRVRGLVPGLKGYWEQFGAWWNTFMGQDLNREEIVKAFVEHR